MRVTMNTFYNAFDTERMEDWGSGADDFRTPFQVDRDRVLHTPAFRRLQSKTQVFWSGEYDFYRTRLTHSLEVAQIGRSICHWLGHSSELLRPDYFIDPELVEVVCLSHDLGHPPFGHAGERSLNYLMKDYGGFEGNAQTLRLLADRIFSVKRTGMNPTRAFLDGILKYKTLWSELCDGDKKPHNHFIYDPQVKHLSWAMGEMDFPVELTAGKKRDGFKSIECQVMDWADDTAYSLNDLADSVRAGFLSVGRIEAWAEKTGESTGQGTPLGDLIKAIKGNRVEPFAGKRIGQYIQAASLREEVNFMSATSNRYRYVVDVDEEICLESALFKRLAYEVVFLSPELKQLEHKGNYILERLWEVFKARYIEGKEISGQDFQLLPDDEAQEIESTEDANERARLVCDFLAGMTDGNATRLYKRLFVPDFGSIGDLVS
jgi:dGTPase